MNRARSLINYEAENKPFNQRCWTALGCVLIVVIILLARLGYLQIKQHHLFTTLSRQNFLNVIPVEPNRGLIVDRNGVILATNILAYSLNLTPGKIKNLKQTIDQLQRIIPISSTAIKDFTHNLYQHHRYDAVPLKLKLSEQEVATFYVNAYRFPGVSIQTHLLRYYPKGQSLASVIGYVGRINAHELATLNKENYSASNYIGKTGIERFYESTLHGKTGVEEVEINAYSRIIRTLKRTPAQSGNTLILSIDSKLQAFALKALGNNSGAVVALDPRDGQVLAMVTNPNFDPNVFFQWHQHQTISTIAERPPTPVVQSRLTRPLCTGIDHQTLFSSSCTQSPDH